MGRFEDLVNQYADGRELDPTVAEELLSPYPELWEKWQADVYRPDALEQMGSGGLERYHSRVFLNRLIAEYQHVSGGRDRPEPALEARCDEIAHQWPGLAEQRKRRLADPWWRATVGPWPWLITQEYDPEHLEDCVAMLREHADPYSAASIKSADTAKLLRQGGTWVSVDPETGEEDCVIELDPQPEGRGDFD